MSNDEYQQQKEYMKSEQSKYYTPTIEEFHVGFEYQRLSYDENNKSEYVTVKYPCGYIEYQQRLSALEDSLKDSKFGIRVKYLDQEDIESLGWVYTGKSIDMWFKKEGIFNAISGGHKFDEYKLHYGLHDNCLYINAYFGGQDEGRLFEGIIKNKSELKRLMKQLGIC